MDGNWTEAKWIDPARFLLESDPEIRDAQAGGQAIVALGHLVEAINKITDPGFVHLTETEQELLNIYRVAARAIFEHLESREQGLFRDTQYFEPGTEEAIRKAIME